MFSRSRASSTIGRSVAAWAIWMSLSMMGSGGHVGECSHDRPGLRHRMPLMTAMLRRVTCRSSIARCARRMRAVHPEPAQWAYPFGVVPDQRLQRGFQVVGQALRATQAATFREHELLDVPVPLLRSQLAEPELVDPRMGQCLERIDVMLGRMHIAVYAPSGQISADCSDGDVSSCERRPSCEHRMPSVRDRRLTSSAPRRAPCRAPAVLPATACTRCST